MHIYMKTICIASQSYDLPSAVELWTTKSEIERMMAAISLALPWTALEVETGAAAITGAHLVFRKRGSRLIGAVRGAVPSATCTTAVLDSAARRIAAGESVIQRGWPLLPRG